MSFFLPSRSLKYSCLFQVVISPTSLKSVCSLHISTTWSLACLSLLLTILTFSGKYRVNDLLDWWESLLRSLELSECSESLSEKVCILSSDSRSDLSSSGVALFCTYPLEMEID